MLLGKNKAIEKLAYFDGNLHYFTTIQWIAVNKNRSRLSAELSDLSSGEHYPPFKQPGPDVCFYRGILADVTVYILTY